MQLVGIQIYNLDIARIEKQYKEISNLVGGIAVHCVYRVVLCWQNVLIICVPTMPTGVINSELILRSRWRPYKERARSEQWGINCTQRFKNCGPPTTGCPWTSFVPSCISVRALVVTYRRGSHSNDFYCYLKYGDFFEKLERKIQNLVKIGQKINVGCFTSRRQYEILCSSTILQKGKAHCCIYMATLDNFMLWKANCRSRRKQDRQGTYDVLLRRVLIIIVAIEKQ